MLKVSWALVVDFDEIALHVCLVVELDGRIAPHDIVEELRDCGVFLEHHGIDRALGVDLDPRRVHIDQEASALFALELDGVVLRMVGVKINVFDEIDDLHVVDALHEEVASDVRSVLGSKVINYDLDVVIDVVVVDVDDVLRTIFQLLYFKSLSIESCLYFLELLCLRLRLRCRHRRRRAVFCVNVKVLLSGESPIAMRTRAWIRCIFQGSRQFIKVLVRVQRRTYIFTLDVVNDIAFPRCGVKASMAFIYHGMFSFNTE